MNLLLDTHALLWALAAPEKLPETVADALVSPRNAVFVSAVSTWELVIKAGLGRLELPFPDLASAIGRAGFVELSITVQHSLRVHDLPHHHRDPFDRLLVAQAQDEGMFLVSGDRAFRSYPVQTLWA